MAFTAAYLDAICEAIVVNNWLIDCTSAAKADSGIGFGGCSLRALPINSQYSAGRDVESREMIKEANEMDVEENSERGSGSAANISCSKIISVEIERF